MACRVIAAVSGAVMAVSAWSVGTSHAEPAPATVIASAGVEAGGRLCLAVGAEPGDLALVNLTPVNATAAGNGQLVSSGVADPPIASNVNFAPGTVDPNVAAATVGTDRRVCFVNSVHGRVDLVADPLVAVRADAVVADPGAGSRRVLDTRAADRPAISPNERRCFTVAGRPGDLAVVNLTPLDATAPGNGQLVSSDVTGTPLASNVNFAPGTVDPNVATATIGADRRVCYLSSQHATVDVVADHLATIDATSLSATAPSSMRVDTRVTGSVTASSCLPSGRCLAALDADGSGFGGHTYAFAISTDGGRSWRHATTTFPDFSFFQSGWSAGSIVCTSDTLCEATSDTAISTPAAGTNRVVWITTDAGETWTAYADHVGGSASPAPTRTPII